MKIELFIRIAALSGVTLLLLAAISSAFSLQIARRWHKPFTKIHHPLAFAGFALILLHPILVALDVSSARVFIPTFNSWKEFWNFAGCPALILIILAVVAALAMRAMPRFWRWGHWLIYPAVFMGGIHALRHGQDLKKPVVAVVLVLLLALVLLTFLYKRRKTPGLKKPDKT